MGDGRELREEELRDVVAGRKNSASATNDNEKYVTAYCDKCGKNTQHIVYSGGRAKCKECNTVSTI